MNRSSKLLLYIFLIASLGANGILLVLVRWDHERIQVMSEDLKLTMAAEQIKIGTDRATVYKLIGRLPNTSRSLNHRTTVDSWMPDSHKPFLHRMRFGSDPGNGSYYLDVEFDTNDTVVAVRSGNF